MEDRQGLKRGEAEQCDQPDVPVAGSRRDQASTLLTGGKRLHPGDVRSDARSPHATGNVPAFLRLEAEPESGMPGVLDREVGVVSRAIRTLALSQFAVRDFQDFQDFLCRKNLFNVGVRQNSHTLLTPLFGSIMFMCALLGRITRSAARPRLQ